MKKILASVAVLSVLMLTGCGEAVYGKPGTEQGIEEFKQFSTTCTDAGGRLAEGPRDWYTCEMGGS